MVHTFPRLFELAFLRLAVRSLESHVILHWWRLPWCAHNGPVERGGSQFAKLVNKLLSAIQKVCMYAGRVSGEHAANSPGSEFLPVCRSGAATIFSGRGDSCMLLVNFVLDVPAETVPEDLARPRCLDHAAERENPHTQDRCLGARLNPRPTLA